MELKTRKNDASVTAFLDSITDQARRADCQTVMQLMSEITGAPPEMWGTSIIGFGNYRYKYATGREGDWFVVGFSPRKQALTLYIMGYLVGREDALARLGTYKMGKSCLYVKRLSDIDLDVLRELIQASVADLEHRYPRRDPATSDAPASAARNKAPSQKKKKKKKAAAAKKTEKKTEKKTQKKTQKKTTARNKASTTAAVDPGATRVAGQKKKGGAKKVVAKKVVARRER